MASPSLQPRAVPQPGANADPLDIASRGDQDPSDEQAGSLARRLITVQLLVAASSPVFPSRTRGRPIRRPPALQSTVSAKRVDARSRRLPQEETDEGRQSGPFVVKQSDEPRNTDGKQLRPILRASRLSLERDVAVYTPVLGDCYSSEQAGRTGG